jgi:hypothetical protein
MIQPFSRFFLKFSTPLFVFWLVCSIIFTALERCVAVGYDVWKFFFSGGKNMFFIFWYGGKRLSVKAKKFENTMKSKLLSQRNFQTIYHSIQQSSHHVDSTITPTTYWQSNLKLSSRWLLYRTFLIVFISEK